MNSIALILTLALYGADQDPAPPRVLDDRLQLQLVLSDPQIVTPTGLAVDDKGRVLVIECNTHFPPAGYKGHPTDRIWMLENIDASTGKPGKLSVYYEGTKATMGIATHSDGSVYVATRMEILRLRDPKQEGRGTQRTEIVRLETKGDYPHNGLAGMAFDLLGNLYFGLGENLGADYKLIATDGKELVGGGEGGNIYTCDSDGKNLRRIATGFWNPFGVGFDGFGRLFAVDNDPDSRPPCRLLHIVEGGDYGYRFRNGRKGVHPFTAWNGELPGTLPMVSGTGEAPCAVLAYESDNLPDEYRGDLLVTSWGDHRLERYRLKKRGASFAGEMTPLVVGGENFRPVGLGLAPDGSLYFSDWVDKSYQLHGKGRVWRLSTKKAVPQPRPSDPLEAVSSSHGPLREWGARKLDSAAAKKLAGEHANSRTRSAAARVYFREQPAVAEVAGLLAQEHPEMWDKFVVDAAAYLKSGERLAKFPSLDSLPLGDETRVAQFRALGFDGSDFSKSDLSDPFLQAALVRSARRAAFPTPLSIAAVQFFIEAVRESKSSELRTVMCLGYRNSHPANEKVMIPFMLRSTFPGVRFLGIQWTGEGRHQEFKADLEETLRERANTRQLFEACLTSLDMLAGKPRDPKQESPGEEYVLAALRDEKTSAALRRFALRTLRPDHPGLTTNLLEKLLADKEASVRLEAIRTIRQRPDSERWPALREISGGAKHSTLERCEAMLGLSPGNHADRKLLMQLTADAAPEVSAEALRALRGFDLEPGEKAELEKLSATLTGPHQELAQRAVDRNPPRDLPQGADLEAWLKRADGRGDPAAGERIFFHPRVGGCFRCHEMEGRGYAVGPNVSTLGKTLSRERLVQSIVDPSREIAPQFTAWTILKKDGEVVTGMYLGEEVDGAIKYADQNGRVFRAHPRDIEQRKPSPQSIMPQGLMDNLTPQELRDLIAYLRK